MRLLSDLATELMLLFSNLCGIVAYLWFGHHYYVLDEC